MSLKITEAMVIKAKPDMKKEFDKLLPGLVNAIGVTKSNGELGAFIGLASEPPKDINLPTSINGIPVWVHVLGGMKLFQEEKADIS